MSKYNRNRRLGKRVLSSRKRATSRVWYHNVGDGAKLAKEMGGNPNDRLVRPQ